jgi:hypothetical protein
MKDMGEGQWLVGCREWLLVREKRRGRKLR